MKVRVRLFASYREAAGTEWVDLDLPAQARAADLLEHLVSRLGMTASPARALVARRMEVIGPDTPLAEGDDLAVLPPLSGGA